MAIGWNNYIEYLKDWARQHEEQKFEGMSPICYGEFLDNENEQEQKVKYFTVHKEELRGSLASGEVFANGEYINEADELEIRTLTTGYTIYEYDEQGKRTGTEFYPVTTDMEAWENDEKDVLENVKCNYLPEEGWQNVAW